MGTPLHGLRKSLFRSHRGLGGPHQPGRTRRRRLEDRANQLRTPAAFRRKAQLEPHDGRQDPAGPPARVGRTLAQPLVVLEPRRPRPVREHRPGAVDRMRAQPHRVPRQTEHRTAQGAGEGPRVPRPARRRICPVHQLHEREARPLDDDRFLLLDGVRPALVAQNLLGRPGHPSGRLPQGGFGQERADGRRGSAVPLRLLHPASLGAGRTGSDLRSAELLQAAHFARARRGGQLAHHHHRVPGPHALGARLEMPGRTHRPVPAGHRFRGQPRRRPSDHPLPLRRRLGEPPQAGDSAGHRRHPGPAQAGRQAPGVPLQRGSRRVHRHRTHPRDGEPQEAVVLRSARSRPLVVALHDAHPRARRSRRIPRADDPPVHVALPRCAGHHVGAVHQPRQDQSQRPQREVLDVRSGLQPFAGSQRRVVAPRRGVERHSGQHVAGLLQERTPHRLRDQRRALPDVDRHLAAPSLCPLLRRRLRGPHL